MSVTLTNTQGRAVDKIQGWLKNDTHDKQVFRLFGYAGTGKTTILRQVIGELGLRDSEVCYAAFTGKASLVMQRHGLPATTIHSLIYKVSLSSDDRIESEEGILKQMIEDKKDKKLIREQKLKVSRMKSPHFYPNEDSDAANAKLIVLDEVSMVDKQLGEDLLSFGTPILVVGDPGQLPPVSNEKGEGFFMRQKPDVMLTQIHRQALDSPIIRLATMVREGQKIPEGKYGPGVRKVPVIHKVGTYLKYDQIICGYHKTRYRLNNEIRQKLGFKGNFPTGEAEKIICQKNIYDLGLINGLFIVLKNTQEYTEDYIQADIYNEDGELLVGGAIIYRGDFLQHVKFKRDRIENDYKARRGYVEATYGWVITCHKAQGSQWNNIMVVADGWGRTPLQRRQWLYTAITRAESRLTIVG